jgi:hypothetical protein
MMHACWQIDARFGHKGDVIERLQAWAKLATLEAHQQWSRALEPFVVSGTAHWTVWRVI